MYGVSDTITFWKGNTSSLPALCDEIHQNVDSYRKEITIQSFNTFFALRPNRLLQKLLGLHSCDLHDIGRVCDAEGHKM